MYTRREGERSALTGELIETRRQESVLRVDVHVFIRALGFTPTEVAEVHMKSNVVLVIGTSKDGQAFRKHLRVQG